MKTKNIDYRNRILLELAENNQFLFSWGDIRGNDNRRLVEERRGTGKRYLNPELYKFYFLMRKFEGIYWIKTAKIAKIDDGNTIRIYNGKKFLSLTLNDKKTKVNLEIDGRKAIEFVARTENGKLNIYNKDSYTILELRALTGLGFQTIDNILKEKEISNFVDIVEKRGIRDTKAFKLIEDFDKFIELVCYVKFIDGLMSFMCTEYYKKFELEFRDRINKEPEYITGRYFSAASYDSSRDIYDNIKENNFTGLKKIAREIRDKEEKLKLLKSLKSQPSDKITNLRIKIIEAELKSQEELKLLKPDLFRRENTEKTFRTDIVKSDNIIIKQTQR